MNRIVSRLAPLALSLSALVTASSATAQCVCDCDGDGGVRINDLVRLSSIALGLHAISACPSYTENPIHIDSLIECVNVALGVDPCRAPNAPTPTTTPTMTPSATRSSTPLPAATFTATVLPPADPQASDLAARLLASVFVCSTLSTPGGRVDIGQTPAGAWLKCDSFTGHNGTFFFDKFPSAAAAAAAFGELTAEETVGDVGGGVLRQLERETPCCFDGSSTSWSWLRDCWLARGSTFDDTHFILTPRGTRVAEAIAASELAEELFGLCSR